MLKVSRQSARDSYIDIFDVLNADMRSAGLTQDRAVTSIRTTQRSKNTEGGLDQFEDYAQRAAELSADLIATYMVDPQFMKEVAPKSAQFARVS